jgi:hypothetical protein
MDEVVTVDQCEAVGSIIFKPRAEKDPVGVNIQGGGENVEFAVRQHSIVVVGLTDRQKIIRCEARCRLEETSGGVGESCCDRGAMEQEANGAVAGAANGVTHGSSHVCVLAQPSEALGFHGGQTVEGDRRVHALECALGTADRWAR